MKKRKKRIIKQPISDKASEIAEALRAVLGKDSVSRSADSELGEPRMFIPSGVPDLDRVLDREERGWPTGRIIEIYGGEATAKTGIGYSLIAQVQKAGGSATLHPAEGNVDDWLLERYLVDRGGLLIVDDPSVEGTFEAYDAALKAVGKYGLLVSVIDSIAGLSTRDELNNPKFDRDRAAQLRAFLLSKAMRKLGGKVPRTNSILFCINQVRDSTDSVPSKPKPPGGRAIKFYASIRLRMELLKKITRTRKGRKYVAAFHIRITAEKNRLANPFEQAEIVIDFEKGIFGVDEYSKLMRKRKI